jgi:hypothetical protein
MELCEGVGLWLLLGLGLWCESKADLAAGDQPREGLWAWLLALVGGDFAVGEGRRWGDSVRAVARALLLLGWTASLEVADRGEEERGS